MEDEKYINEFIQGIYLGFITVNNLSQPLYAKISEKLITGVYQGYGNTFKTVKFASDEYYILEQLHNNIYRFSAAKSFQLTNDLSVLKLDSNGNLKTFTEFKKDAEKIYKIYNKDWLEAEFETAISQADSAAYWKEIESDKNTFPLLKYVTAGDEAVREEHKKLDGIVRPVGDDFWKWAMPPNGFNCRCIVQQHTTETANVTDLKGNLKSDVPIQFQFNPGKEKLIFIEKGQKQHPYFKVPNKYHDYRDRNFGLAIPRI